jgi:cytoskeletal protein CcmA (bactofilin family)
MVSPLKFFSRGSADGPDWAGFLDSQARIEGTLEVPGTFRLDGALKGRILSGHSLVLGETAQVEGEIEGKSVVIFGRFHGTIRATERVEIHENAAVFADLYTPSLSLEPGGRLHGHCYLNPAGVDADPVLVPIRANAPEEPTVVPQDPARGESSAE